MNYKESGVDVEKGDYFVNKIKPLIKSTYNEKVVAGVGGFAALYDQGDNYLVSGTDGVGTKIKLAIELDKHDTIGIDLVAMCVNDILCTGATPSFFLDYLATSALNIETHHQVIKGITDGCLQSGCALIGGETAEMPGMYQNNDYDLAGFALGHLPKNKYINGENIEHGMKIYALPSSGFHSNGYSLIRKILENESNELKVHCLTPTRIYAKEVKDICQNFKIHGMAHITGGGLNNIKRINENFGYKITTLPQLPDFMDSIISKSKLSLKEVSTTFNMGIGFVFIAHESEKLDTYSEELIEIGTVENNFIGVNCLGTEL